MALRYVAVPTPAEAKLNAQFIEGVIATFLHVYASATRTWVKLVEAIGWGVIREMLERGEIHRGQNLARAETDDRRFSACEVGNVHFLAVSQAAYWPRGAGSVIKIEELAGRPLLHGVAIIPSTLQVRTPSLSMAGLAYRGRPLQESLAIFWDRTRSLAAFATAFCELLAAHVRSSSAPPPARRRTRPAARRGTARNAVMRSRAG